MPVIRALGLGEEGTPVVGEGRVSVVTVGSPGIAARRGWRGAGTGTDGTTLIASRGLRGVPLSRRRTCPELAPCRLRAGRLSWLQRAGPSATLDKALFGCGRMLRAGPSGRQAGVLVGRRPWRNEGETAAAAGGGAAAGARPGGPERGRGPVARRPARCRGPSPVAVGRQIDVGREQATSEPGRPQGPCPRRQKATCLAAGWQRATDQTAEASPVAVGRHPLVGAKPGGCGAWPGPGGLRPEAGPVPGHVADCHGAAD